ncbi:cytochrome-c oxidase [Algicella marina]|uniref:Cytochrome-c oxidase n=1 Tax=Algicella marina TaxID=2683284 RepID=A0A6P1T7W1_9RHOB|nr:cytochrome-c oxidase [Algicella marina]
MHRHHAAILAAILFLTLYLPAWSTLAGAFPIHMVRHIVLVAIIAPLLVLATPRIASRAAVPVLPATALEFAVIWGWHLPGLHGAAQTGSFWFVAEQASFLLAGWAVWAGALSAREPLLGSGGLFLTSMHMTLLGALLILAPDDLYAEICGRAPDLSGQQLGGILMLCVGTPVYLISSLVLAGTSLKGAEG